MTHFDAPRRRQQARARAPISHSSRRLARLRTRSIERDRRYWLTCRNSPPRDRTHTHTHTRWTLSTWKQSREPKVRLRAISARNSSAKLDWFASVWRPALKRGPGRSQKFRADKQLQPPSRITRRARARPTTTGESRSARGPRRRVANTHSHQDNRPEARLGRKRVRSRGTADRSRRPLCSTRGINLVQRRHEATIKRRVLSCHSFIPPGADSRPECEISGILSSPALARCRLLLIQIYALPERPPLAAASHRRLPPSQASREKFERLEMKESGQKGGGARRNVRNRLRVSFVALALRQNRRQDARAAAADKPKRLGQLARCARRLRGDSSAIVYGGVCVCVCCVREMGDERWEMMAASAALFSDERRDRKGET